MVILNATINTQRATVTQDAQGTPVENWSSPTVIDSNVAASIQQMSQAEISAYQRRGVSADVEVYTRVAMAAKLNDRISDQAVNLYTIINTSDMAGRGRWFVTVCKQVVTGS